MANFIKLAIFHYLAQKGVQRSKEIHKKMPCEEKNTITSGDLDLLVAKLALV